MTVYTDRLGRKVLERRGPESRKGSNDTYFVYNDLGQLRYVLTPGYELSGYKDKFAYEYRYDESGKVVKKFIPGAGYTQYWYDRAGRLTFMQDENLRASGLHRFFVYDKAGRQVIQGVSALCSRGKEVNAAAYTGGSSGFMSTGYTLSDGSRLQQVTLECVDYYDGYDFVDAGDHRLAKSGTASATGLPTGETVYSSDGSRSVSASYYDEKGNIVEQRELTAFGTLRVTSTTYNYSGLPLSTVMTEKDITVQTDNTYHDSTGLLLHTDVTVNGTRQRVSSLTYDDLGRVIADTRGDGAAVTGTSYTYDLHGRVTSISGPGFSQRLHYADGPGNRLYNGMISSMSWTMGNDATERGYRYAYNDFNWLTAAEYGEGSSLDSHKNRYTERFTEFMPNGGVRRLQRHGLKADGEYGKIDNLHIYYEGNRIKEVLEDAEPTTQTGSTDFSGKTSVRSSFEYNAWGALVRDDSRNISSVAYDNLGNPVGVEFSSSDGSEAKYVYSAKGERLKAEHRVNVTVEVNPVSKAPQLSDGSSAGDISPITPNLLVTTRLEYHGQVVYRNGKVNRVLFSGGYATIDGGNVTFHYYTQDHQGSNRAVVNGTTGAVEQTVAYYPYSGVIADLGTGAGIQPCKFGGKELTLYNGLDEYDFGARQYYPAVPHFTRIDPLCEQDYWLSPYLYCANDPVNLTDPTGMSTRVKQLADGTYEVLGGDLTDDDKNIYLYNKDVNGQYTIKKQSIGITTSITSFYDSDNSMWKTGSIIDPNDKSGQKFLSHIINNNPPLFDDYIVNARNNHTYDFKVTNGTSKAIPGINIYRGMAIGFNSNGQTIYTSARDIGNIAAGYIAAVNGLSWADARMGFDGYQFITSSKFEGLSTRNAELYGWMMGYKQTTRSQKIHNMSNSIKSPIKKSSNKLWNIIKEMFE